MSDILVIGGGIAGISVAARLAPFADVLVLDGEDALGYHASGRSAAMFEEHYGSNAVLALNRASRSFHEDGGYLSPRGILIVTKPEQVDVFERDLEVMRCEEISLSAARAMVPILGQDVVRAGYEAGAQDIDTDLLLQDFVREIRQHGGQIELGAKVSGIKQDSTGWIVSTNHRDFRATTVINAAGAWADDIAALAGIAPIGLTAYRRSMARLPAPRDLDLREWPMFFGPGESWYAKPDAGKLLVSPADEDPLPPQDAWADDMMLAEGLDRYSQHVDAPVTRVETSWAGLRTFAPDRQLVLGRDPETPDFVWCAGQGGYGFATAPAASQFLSDIVLGRSTVLEKYKSALTPERLR